MEVLPGDVVEGVEVAARRVAGLGARDVEPDHAVVPVADRQLRDLERSGRRPHGGEERADRDGTADASSPEPLEHGFDDLVGGEPALQVQFGREAHLRVDDAVRGEVLGALRRDPRQRLSRLHDRDRVGERLEVELQALAVRPPGEPPADFDRIRAGQSPVAALPGKVDHGGRPQPAVQVVMQQHLRCGAYRLLVETGPVGTIERHDDLRAAGAPSCKPTPALRQVAGRSRMEPMRTLIVDGTVVNADGSQAADVLIEGERIVAVEPGLGERAGAADRRIDAAGRLVIPGAVDAHTHMELPVGAVTSKDTFETGTRAAAFGGTTTIIDFATQAKGGSLREGLDAWHAKADGRCSIDYGFHMAMCDVNDGTLAEMGAMVAEGVPTFKLFTAYPDRMYSDDGAILRAMFQTAGNGGLVLMHAENGIAVDVLAERYVAAGHTDPWYHGLAHASALEGEAAHRVIALAEIAGVPVYIVHVSAREAVEEVRRARERGLPVFAETCPQYLFLSLDLLKGSPGDPFEGAKFVCSPPLRTPEHQAAVWQGLADGDLQVVGTDHCPFDFAGQKDIGRGDFRTIPNGLPGVEERVDLLHDDGASAGRFSRERWVELIAAAPARLFGLWGRKGAVAPGFDADVVVYDPDRRHTLSARTHHMNVDYSCYEGREVQGGSDVVVSRGEVIVEAGEWRGRPGRGRFLRRELPLQNG